MNRQRFERLPMERLAFSEIPRLRRTEVLALRWLHFLGGDPLARKPEYRLGEGGEVRSIRNRELARLIRLGCVEVMELRPARYRVTRLGRIAAALNGPSS